MKGRLPHLGIVGGALTFLVSLYLPWINPNGTPPAPAGQGGALSLLNLFSRYSHPFELNGWNGFGEAAALVALALLCGAAVPSSSAWSLRRPRFGVTCAFALFTFTALAAASVR